MNFVAQNVPELACQNLVKLEPKGTVSFIYSISWEEWTLDTLSAIPFYFHFHDPLFIIYEHSFKHMNNWILIIRFIIRYRTINLCIMLMTLIQFGTKVCGSLLYLFVLLHSALSDHIASYWILLWIDRGLHTMCTSIIQWSDEQVYTHFICIF